MAYFHDASNTLKPLDNETTSLLYEETGLILLIRGQSGVKYHTQKIISEKLKNHS